MPSEPTSLHWYSVETLNKLVFSHIAHAKGGGTDLPIGTFVRQFAGLTSTAKAKAVLSHMPSGITHLSDFERDQGSVPLLLVAMNEHAKEPKAASLGCVGKEHFGGFFEAIYGVDEFKYVKREGTMPSGLPFVFEFAIATVAPVAGHLYCGVNFSPTFGDPVEGTTLMGPKFNASGIRGFLSQGHALPKAEDAWFDTPTSVAVATHIVTPAPLFLDRGKTRLDMEGA